MEPAKRSSGKVNKSARSQTTESSTMSKLAFSLRFKGRIMNPTERMTILVQCRKNKAKEVEPMIVGNTCDSLPPEYQDECRKNGAKQILKPSGHGHQSDVPAQAPMPETWEGDYEEKEQASNGVMAMIAELEAELREL